MYFIYFKIFNLHYQVQYLFRHQYVFYVCLRNFLLTCIFPFNSHSFQKNGAVNHQVFTKKYYNLKTVYLHKFNIKTLILNELRQFFFCKIIYTVYLISRKTHRRKSKTNVIFGFSFIPVCQKIRFFIQNLINKLIPTKKAYFLSLFEKDSNDDI